MMLSKNVTSDMVLTAKGFFVALTAEVVSRLSVEVVLRFEGHFDILWLSTFADFMFFS